MRKFALMTLLGAGAIALPVVAEDKKPETPKIEITKPGETPKAEAPIDEKEMREKVSYAAGMHLGNLLKQQEYDFDFEEVSKAMKDTLAGGATKLTEEDAQKVLAKWQETQRPKMEARRVKQREEAMAKQKAQGEENKKKADAFLAENAKKPGIKSIEPGLQYEVITEGSGKMPTSTDRVKVHYTGTLLDGKEFDSSRKRGTPAEFAVTGVIKGWTDALQKMPAGSRWKLYIAPELAYGESGRPNIPPNSLLVFDVELIEVVAPVSAAPKNDESVQAVSGEIIKVPSAEELKKGAKIEVLKEEDVKKMLATNAPNAKATNADKPQSK